MRASSSSRDLGRHLRVVALDPRADEVAVRAGHLLGAEGVGRADAVAARAVRAPVDGERGAARRGEGREAVVRDRDVVHEPAVGRVDEVVQLAEVVAEAQADGLAAVDGQVKLAALERLGRQRGGARLGGGVAVGRVDGRPRRAAVRRDFDEAAVVRLVHVPVGEGEGGDAARGDRDRVLHGQRGRGEAARFGGRRLEGVAVVLRLDVRRRPRRGRVFARRRPLVESALRVVREDGAADARLLQRVGAGRARRARPRQRVRAVRVGVLIVRAERERGRRERRAGVDADVIDVPAVHAVAAVLTPVEAHLHGVAGVGQRGKVDDGRAPRAGGAPGAPLTFVPVHAASPGFGLVLLPTGGGWL